jgi:CRP-like cAMP-binding protein
MKNIFESVKEHPLFKGTSFDEFEKALSCLLAKSASYRKNDIVWLAGTPAQFVGLLMSGSVRVTKNDANGNTVILTDVTAPNFLGEIGVWAELESFPVTVHALSDCVVYFLDGRKITSVCSSACQFHKNMIENMLRTISKKAFMLDQKVEVLSKRTIREKLLCFFDTQRGSAKKFTSPFSREGMARYLCVNRSALSDELGKMRDEGLIRFHRDEFEIL